MSNIIFLLFVLIFVSIYLNLTVPLGPGVCSAPNKNEYKEQKNNEYKEHYFSALCTHFC
jgi:hypothetical protein